MDKIAVLPLFGSLYFISQGSAKKAFIYYFLPVLTFMPTYYQTKLVPGIPELSFWSAALIPIFIVWVTRDGMEGFKFTIFDGIVLLYLLCIFYGEFSNSSYKIAQKVFFNEVIARFIPYLMIKSFFTDQKTRVEIIKVIVICGAIIAVGMIWEFKQSYNIFDKPIRNLWPTWVPWERPMRRWGFKRAFASFAHPICAGYFYAVISPMAFWYWKGDYIPKKYKKWAPKIYALSVIGCLTAMSRAPMAGLALSLLIIWYGWAKDRKKVMSYLLVIFTIFFVVFFPKIWAYVNVKRTDAETVDQRNAAYRSEMIENYRSIVEERPYFGWGRFGVPWVEGQKSIDNEYLFTALTSGKVVLYLFDFLMIFQGLKLLMFVFKHPYNNEEARLGWCFLGALLSAAFIMYTVYAGTQTVQYLFMLLGMSEGLCNSKILLKKGKSQEKQQKLALEVGNGYHFSRTL
ncbi:MAG: hypothetical protein DWQ06_01130 [Calditrichaeota bacterium]|nr:MAG: hypothetical protein DWQ06_01130 [Calditrichota bacterium]